MPHFLRLSLVLLGLLRVLVPSVMADDVSYLQHIKPVLKERCWACHGALKQQAGLRLDTAAAARKGGESGAVIDRTHPAQSRLLERVTSTDLSVRMPPEGKPLSEHEVTLLRRWIESGAPAPANEAPEADPREHWAFQPPQRSKWPDGTSSTHPVDAFVEARLQQQHLQPRPRAPKSVLLRRVFLDLIGLPPTPQELAEFLNDESPMAYEQVVDRLLNDPRHGERWARHWMDVWRYSDWYGRRNVPDVWNSAPQIWRWRDWIVRSLNADKGYDRMLQEMLAADEICPEDAEAAVATGYLIRNWYALNPNDWMRNTVEHTSKAFVGLTLNCAHCHDHKYDPLTQENYFQWRAFFEPMGIRQDRVPDEADPGPFQEYNYSQLRKIQRLGAVSIFDKQPAAPTWLYTGGDERNRVTARGSIAPGVPEFLLGRPIQIEPISLPVAASFPGSRPEIQRTARQEIEAALAAAEAELNLKPADGAALTLADQNRFAAAEARRDAARLELASLSARIAADLARHQTPPASDATALSQAALRAEQTAKLGRARADLAQAQASVTAAEALPTTDANRAKQLDAAMKQVTTATMSVVTAEAALQAPADKSNYTSLTPSYPTTSTGRRRALAEWITDRRHPLTARVAVNHVWMRHFQSPLVSTVFDFGRNGATPTHPELLDWLAVDLMESGWSMKRLHRLLVTSDAYCRDSRHDATNAETDPENKLFWRMSTGRMEAEVLRDSLLSLADQLDPHQGGQELENSAALTSRRRSLYFSVFPELGGKNAIGELFDGPDALDCYRRSRSIVPQQALALTNSDLVHQVATAIATAIAAETRQSLSPEDPSLPQKFRVRFVKLAFERVLSRSPTPAESALCEAELSDTDPRSHSAIVRALLNHNDFVAIR